MASFGHVAVGMAAARGLLPAGVSRQRLAGAMTGLSLLSLLPDADVVGLRLGVPYGAEWGHRGASHSLAVAALVGGVAALLAPRVGLSRVRGGLTVGLVVASHGLLDALTDGGLGAALLWPLSHARLFAPLRPLPVAPIGAGMLTARGLFVGAVEVLAFLPLWLFALWPRRAAPGRLA